MKRFILCNLIFIFFNNINAQSVIFKSPVKFQNMLVADIDLSHIITNSPKLDWFDAKRHIERVGDEWRLPTIEELKIIYENKEKFNDLKSDIYWSSTRGTGSFASRLNFGNGKVFDRDTKDNTALVRVVKTISNQVENRLTQKSVTFPNGNKYDGEWENDKMSGQGTFTFSNGEKYVGQFKDGKRNGEGTFTFSNGGTYIGEWKDDKENGKGTFILNGIFTKGIYENGVYIGKEKTEVVQNIQSNNNSVQEPVSSFSSATSIIDNPVKIGDLLVAQFDFPNKMNWENAKAACERLGNGWRLPTKDELQILYATIDQPSLHKKLGGFLGTYYWSSEAYDEKAWMKAFDDGRWYERYCRQQFSVRPVFTPVSANSNATKKSENQNKVSLSNKKNPISIEGYSLDDLMKLAIKAELSGEKPNLDPESPFYSKSSSSANKNYSAPITKSSNASIKHTFKVIITWNNPNCRSCPFPRPSAQNGTIDYFYEPSGSYRVKPKCPSCGKTQSKDISGFTENIGTSKQGSKVVTISCN